MKREQSNAFRRVLVTTVCFAGLFTSRSAAQEAPATAAPPSTMSPVAVRLTLDEIKERVLANNKLLNLAAPNIQSKSYATRAAQALYFPQIIGNVVYFHFDDFLGSVLTTGRTITGPRGQPLLTLPTRTVDVAVVSQDTTFSTIAAVQPLTDLLKVRQGVKIAQADEQIAQAQLNKGRRELHSGIEQLF